MTKILYVYGGDYAASAFNNLVENGIVSADDLWQRSQDANSSLEYEHEDDWFEYIGHEFDDIDPEFIEFVYETEDYDSSKHSHFYVVEE